MVGAVTTFGGEGLAELALVGTGLGCGLGLGFVWLGLAALEDLVGSAFETV